MSCHYQSRHYFFITWILTKVNSVQSLSLFVFLQFHAFGFKISRRTMSENFIHDWDVWNNLHRFTAKKVWDERYSNIHQYCLKFSCQGSIWSNLKKNSKKLSINLFEAKSSFQFHNCDNFEKNCPQAIAKSRITFWVVRIFFKKKCHSG